MKGLFRRNIDKKGRVARGLAAAALLVGAGIAWATSVWLALVLFAAGIFVAFEALRGWCALRACGIKTKL